MLVCLDNAGDSIAGDCGVTERCLAAREAISRLCSWDGHNKIFLWLLAGLCDSFLTFVFGSAFLDRVDVKSECARLWLGLVKRVIVLGMAGVENVDCLGEFDAKDEESLQLEENEGEEDDAIAGECLGDYIILVVSSCKIKFNSRI